MRDMAIGQAGRRRRDFKTNVEIKARLNAVFKSTTQLAMDVLTDWCYDSTARNCQMCHRPLGDQVGVIYCRSCRPNLEEGMGASNNV